MKKQLKHIFELESEILNAHSQMNTLYLKINLNKLLKGIPQLEKPTQALFAVDRLV
jgi:galactitol-specific phosphotransferase system IIC component